MTTTTYAVTGMSCEHCVNAVTSELSGLGGVSAVTVDLVPGGSSSVTVASDAPLPGGRGQRGPRRGRRLPDRPVTRRPLTQASLNRPPAR